MKYHRHLNRANMLPKQALDVLMEGNRRFINNLSANHDVMSLVAATSDGQFPFAAILSCSDSRVPTELVFDQTLGDIFSVRLAGNIASLKAIASLEYACKFLGSKIIVVLGHTNCGGVKGACDNLTGGNLPAIFSDIKPAIEAETKTAENRTSANPQFLHNVTHLNVEHQMRAILSDSPLLREMLEQEKIGLVGGIYDLDNGEVTFYDEDKVFCADSQFLSIQKQLLQA